jgi:WD40 repeat protein
LSHLYGPGQVYLPMNKPTTRRAFLQALGVAAVAGALIHGQESPRALRSESSGERLGKSQVSRPDAYGDPLPASVRARMGCCRLQQGNVIDCLAYSADGKMIVSSAYATGINVWDAASGKRLHHFDLPKDWFLRFAFSGDGATLTCLAGRETVECRLLHVATGAELRRTPISGATGDRGLAIAPGGGLVAIAHDDNSIRLYDTTRGKQTLRIPFRGPAIQQITFSPDARAVAIADVTDTLSVHDTATGKAIAALKRPNVEFCRAAFSPDGRLLATDSRGSGEDAEAVSIWDLSTGKERHRLKGDWAWMCPAFSPDGRLLATGDRRGELALWDVATGKTVRGMRAATSSLACAAFSPDGKTIAAATHHGAITQCDVATGRLLPASAHPTAEVYGLRFTNGGKRLLGDGGVLIAWDTATGRELRRFPEVRGLHWHTPLSPDETLIASAEGDGTIRLWDANTGSELRSLKGHDQEVRALAFSPDSRLLYSGASDQTVRIWDVASGRCLHVLKGHVAEVDELAVSPDGHWLASTSHRGLGVRNDAIRLWDVRTGREVRHLTPGPCLALGLAFSPDSRLLAMAGGPPRKFVRGDLVIWEAATGKVWRTLEGYKHFVGPIVFSPDTRMLAVAGLDGTLRLWELASGQARREFKGHQTTPYSVAFSPDGWLLAASIADAPVYLWDVAPTLPTRTKPSPAELERSWQSLAGADAPGAFEAVTRFIAFPEQAVSFLRAHLKPATPINAGRLQELVRQLDSPRFAERQTAAAELEKLAPQAASSLRRAQEETRSAEIRRRLKEVLDRVEAGALEWLRTVRAVEALEGMATPAAIRLLEELAKGAADAPLTREAAAARDRLRRPNAAR